MTAAETTDWPPIAVQLLIAVGRRTAIRQPAVRYAPADWFQQTAKPKQRQRWSRWTRRLSAAGLLERTTEPSRDRVTHVRLTAAGRDWLREYCGPGAIA